MEEKKVLLSVKDLEVEFRVRGRILTAIRGISLDIYENESIAIVGESAAGKSVFTKTFAGMLDDNGYVSNGSIVFNDPELADTTVPNTPEVKARIKSIHAKLNAASRYENGAAIYRRINELKQDRIRRSTLSEMEAEALDTRIEDLRFRRAETYNLKLTIDPSKEKERLKELSHSIKKMDEELKQLEDERKKTIAGHRKEMHSDTAYNTQFKTEMTQLTAQYREACAQPVSADKIARNEIIAKEIYLSVGRYNAAKRIKAINNLVKVVRNAMKNGLDLNDDATRTDVFDDVAFRVRFLDENESRIHGTCVINLAKLKYAKDWTRIRGRRIATVFQDPMTSLNPIITIGKQISSIIMKHQDCSEVEARARAIEMMRKVGIPNAENRYDDYPFQYSGGMRQRIVIAIALSCQPKILICDEPTTALDVTIQAQILKLIKDLQKEFNYTIVFITHDLGVVANVADRVAVLYAGQIVEVGTTEEVFYDPRHPYTWALLSSLPQLAQRDTELFSITGTPPSLYNKIAGDPFAPRNPYCLKIDVVKAPPMFKITETHYAKTWLLDPRAPKIEKPAAIDNIHDKMIKAFNI